MKILLLHAKNYESAFDRFSNRPQDIAPEEIKEKYHKCKDCVVVLITVEKDDCIEISSELAKEIIKMCKEVKRNDIVLVPFAHLSNNIANSKTTLDVLAKLEEKLKGKLDIIRVHFGSHKSLLLDIYGHPGNVRYREF